ncbi:probable elongation factor 1-beta [Condylostylus longicornis]|uniref:probable elongation factor 1-beta n=1 Tax=Condylostylus longicornis TaxID=2530218 RepID=UPI00244E579B|nr:probable elongation factor 1-beta [Condylostylus longicornis]
MSFGDVKTAKGLEELNSFLADHSYIEGYIPSKADLSVFQAIGKLPTGNLVHAQRWYRHIASFDSKEQSSWGGNALPQAAGGNTTVPDNKAADDDDDVDLFGSDEEDAEAAKIREERLAAYAAKKSKKPALIAKSSVLLDCKPWDDETDMKVMEEKVRTIEMDGLLWGASKLVPVGYGIKKLQIMCVIEDEKVSIDLLTEKIQEFEDFVQSVDIAAFNKI